MSVDGRSTVIGCYNLCRGTVLTYPSQRCGHPLFPSHASRTRYFIFYPQSGKLFTFIAHVPYALYYMCEIGYKAKFWPCIHAIQGTLLLRTGGKQIPQIRKQSCSFEPPLSLIGISRNDNRAVGSSEVFTSTEPYCCHFGKTNDVFTCQHLSLSQNLSSH